MSFSTGYRLELVHKVGLGARSCEKNLGYAHLAIAVSDKKAVNQLVEQLKVDGFPLLNGSQITGEGYYETVIQNPEGNLVEIMTN